MAFYGWKLTSLLCTAIFLLFIVSYYTSLDTADLVCESTLQSRVLEWLSSFVFGLTCAQEDSLESPEGLEGWVTFILRRAYIIWKASTNGRQEALYSCRLEWGTLLDLHFSVKAYHCTPVTVEAAGPDWQMILVSFSSCIITMFGIIDYFIRRDIKNVVFLEAAKNRLIEVDKQQRC